MFVFDYVKVWILIMLMPILSLLLKKMCAITRGNGVPRTTHSLNSATLLY